MKNMFNSKGVRAGPFQSRRKCDATLQNKKQTCPSSALLFSKASNNVRIRSPHGDHIIRSQKIIATDKVHLNRKELYCLDLLTFGQDRLDQRSGRKC